MLVIQKSDGENPTKKSEEKSLIARKVFQKQSDSKKGLLRKASQ